jgi:TetR/AcrR family transcriptional repressor of bet genes
MRSNLLSGLRYLAPLDDAKDIAFGITALIDGLWLRLGLQPNGIPRDYALKQVRDYTLARLAKTA